MIDEMLDKLVDVQRDEFEEYCRREAINGRCCECCADADYVYRGDYYCKECIDDLLNQMFAENYNIADKAEMLDVEVRMI